MNSALLLKSANKILGPAYCYEFRDIAKLLGLLKEHVIDPDTIVKRETLGTNQEKRCYLARKTNPRLARIRKLKGYIA